MSAAEERTAADGRRLSIVFSLLHAGYLRHYGEPIRLLARRGHTVHVVVQRTEKDAGDAQLLEQLQADCPTVTTSVAPGRPWTDGWRRLAWLVRALTDLARYMDPRYENATALKERMARKITLNVGWSKMDPISKSLCTRFVDHLSNGSDARAAQRYLRRLRLAEDAIPASESLKQYLESVGADAVVASPIVEIASPQVEFIKAAKSLRIPSGVCVASWDNLTNKGLIRVIPDRVFVWNDIQRQELAEMHGVSPDSVVLTGAPKFDKWFARTPSTTRDEFLSNVGLDQAQPFVSYLCSSPFIAPDEVSFVRRWLTALRADPRFRDVGVLVRPHPQNARQWNDVELGLFGNAVIFPRAGQQPDAGDASAAFFDTLHHASAVVGVNTSAMIEAAIAGNSVYTILDADFADTQEGTLHFHYLLEANGGFLHEAASIPEHLEQLAAGLEGADEALAQTRAFVERFCRPHGLDVAAAPLVADGIEQLALMPRPAHATPGASALAARGLLYPVAFTIGVIARVTRWRDRLRRRGRSRPVTAAE